MASIEEDADRAGDAKIWWRRAYQTLHRMHQAGLQISPEDRQYLDILADKAR